MSKRLLFLIPVALAVFAAIRFAPVQRVHAQASSGCTNATFSGIYSGVGSGYYASTNGAAVFSAMASLIADGNGNITGVETASNDGAVMTMAVNGTYQVVAPSCLGTVQYTYGGQVISNLSFVIVNGGNTVRYIQTDQGTAITGSVDRQ